MNRLFSRNRKPLIAFTAITLLALSAQPAVAGGNYHGPEFPKVIPTLDYAFPEGFTIGKGTTAYNGSVDGSIYKFDLRTGKGKTLVAPVDLYACTKLGMRWDRRTNLLFVAGCEAGNVLVINANTGKTVMDYPLPLPADIADSDDTLQIVNDLVITRHAVYLTDAHQPLIYKLPLTKKGRLPAVDAATAIRLTGEFVNIPAEDYCCGANGIEVTPDGKTLIVGHSNNAQLFRVDPNTGYSREIPMDKPLVGFLDAIVLYGDTLYVLTPGDTRPEDMVQVVKLDFPRFFKHQSVGKFLGVIRDPDMDGVASGAFYKKSLYVNGGHYSSYPQPVQTWVTRLDIEDVQQP